MDTILRGLDADKAIRVVVALTTELVAEGAKRHTLSGAAAVALGRGLTAASLMTTLTKHDNERVRIATHGDGVLGRMLVDAHGNGRVRGCFVSDRPAKIRLPAGTGRTTLAPLVGAGQLRITRDLGLDQPYEGIAELATGEIDEDLEAYLTTSEQLPSVLRCHVEVDASGAIVRAAGILAQTFPGSGPERLDPIRNAVAGDGLAELLRLDRTPTELMGFALAGAPFDAMEPSSLCFACDCGPERARTIVATLGADDIEKLAGERPSTDIRCTYCGADYELSSDQLRQIAAELRATRS